MTSPAADLYLDLLKCTLTGMVYEDPPIPGQHWLAHQDYQEHTRTIGLDWPQRAPCMIGPERLDNVRDCVERVLADGIPGDLAECLPGDALVSVPAGAAVRATRQPYSGPLIKIATAAGYQLSATPDHPVLTRCGWIPAGSVKEGDYVVSRADLERMGLSNPDIDGVPAPISEVFDSLESRRSERGPFQAVHFNVRSRRGAQVEVVTADRPLAPSRVPAFSEPSGQQCLTSAGLRPVTLPGDGFSGQRGLSPALALLSPRAKSQHGPDRFRVALDTEAHTFARGVCRVPGPADRFINRGLIATVFGNEDRDGFSGQVAADSVVGVRSGPGGGRGPDGMTCPADSVVNRTRTAAVFGGKGPDRLSGKIAADRVVRIGSAPCDSGHVYNLQTTTGWYLADDIIVHNCGVWRGGTVIWMRALLAVAGVTDRSVWVIDSFAGLPAEIVTAEGWSSPLMAELAIPLEQVRRNFGLYGMLDDQVRFLPGWFRDTLPDAPIGSLSVLRLDGDMYESQLDALTCLYPRLSPGGFCIIDDSHLDGCAQAVAEYRGAHGITEPEQKAGPYAVFWRKEG